MLKRLFGETVEGRKAFLKKRLIITGPMVLIGMILLLFGEESISSVLLVVAFYIWGWTMVKRCLERRQLDHSGRFSPDI